MSNEHLSFRLSDDFVSRYKDRPVDWGFNIGAGNSLGELTFLSKYSRLKADGTKERWFETCERVINGMFSIQKDHCAFHKTPWNSNKAQRAAEDAFERMFTFKWTPPGRGIWMMGTPFVKEHGSAGLQNCAFLSTQHLGPRNATRPFVRLMEMSMLGIGVGFDTRGAGKLTIHQPEGEPTFYTIEDSREGWCKATQLVLESFFLPAHGPVVLDYSEIRPAGMPIRGFGGTAAGPGPLQELHRNLERLFEGRAGSLLSSSDIVDIQNMIGRCVVAGNVRRSAELALGFADDKPFLQLKNWELNPLRMAQETGWGNLSNNSVIAEVGGNYEHLVDDIAVNGEPGLFYLDLARSHGRLVDPANNRDYRAMGANPCVEQTLEDNECCTLVETYPTRHETLDDYLKTLKVAYLYAKSVTLLPTHWPETNEVMTRNRRIGTSMSGLAQFVERHGVAELRHWCDAAYEEVRRRDVQYSEWLGVRESIKMTSVKPSGTVSLLAGVTPGVHWPVASDDYIRRQRFRFNEEVIPVLKKAGYDVEPDVMDPEYQAVVAFPTSGPHVRNEREVSVWEKVSLAVALQRHWADNQVSATFSFQPHEQDQIGPILRAFDGQLKSLSFLPLGEGGGVYKQMPYEAVDAKTFEEMRSKVKPINWEVLYNGGSDAVGERFCSNDTCEL